jgi:acyl carrier protein
MGIVQPDVDLSTTLRGDLGLDSLDMVEIVTIMADLDSMVADDDIASLQSVGDLYEHYRSSVAGVTP